MEGSPPPPPRRGYPLETHRGVEAALGFALILIALIVAVIPSDSLELSGGAIAAAAVIGLVLTTLGLATTREGAGVGPAAHRGFDIVLVAAMVILAILFAASGATVEAIIFAAFALAHGILTAQTRYTRAGGE